MEFSKNYKDLASVVVRKFRDENFKNYLTFKNYCLETSKEDFQARNAHSFSSFEKERYHLYNALTPEQNEALDRLVLNQLDSTAFNVLREIEENLDADTSIGLTINGNPIEKVTREFWSGTCFGEYFKWIEQESKFGEYQH